MNKNDLEPHQAAFHQKWRDTRDKLIQATLEEVEELKKLERDIRDKIARREKTAQFLASASVDSLTITQMQSELSDVELTLRMFIE